MDINSEAIILQDVDDLYAKDEEVIRRQSSVMGEATSRLSPERFCRSIMEIIVLKYLRRPTATDVEKLYAFHEQNSGMLGSLECTDWEWFGCPIAYKA
ncbi:putative harbinger transposase-derived protein [Tanacetum coccineum]